MDILFPPYQEIAYFSMSVIGILLGMVYDVFKIKRKMFGSFYIILFFDDFLFWIISAVSFILGIFVLNNGIFRWYELFFCIIGFIFYRLTLSKLIMPVFEFLIRIIKRALRFVFKLLSTPLKFAFKPVKILFRYSVISINNYMYKTSIFRYISRLYSIGSENNE